MSNTKYAENYVGEYNINLKFATITGYSREHDTGATLDVYREEMDVESLSDALDRMRQLGFNPVGTVERENDGVEGSVLTFDLEDASLR